MSLLTRPPPASTPRECPSLRAPGKRPGRPRLTSPTTMAHACRAFWRAMPIPARVMRPAMPAPANRLIPPTLLVPHRPMPSRRKGRRAARRWPAPSPSIEGLPLLRGRPPPPRGAAGLRLRPSLRRVPMPPRPRLLGEPSPAAGRKPPFGEALWLHGTRRRFMASGAGARRSPMRAGRPRTPPSRAPSHVRMPTPTAVMAGPPHAALPRRPTNRSTRARVSPPTPIGGRTPLRTRTAGTEAPLRGPGRRGICAPAGRPAGA